MSWSPIISSEDVVAIHAILVPTANGDGEILLFGGDDHYRPGNEAGQWDHSRRFNCRTPDTPLIYVRSPAYDLFCCGHAYMGDGRPMIGGGTNDFPPDAGGPHHDIHFGGHRQCTIYNYASGNMITAADMNFDPGTPGIGGGRWYPTLCTLPNGDVFIFQGHPDDDDVRHGNDTPERYQLITGRWALLSQVGTLTGDPILYPRIFVLNDGRIFVSSQIFGYGDKNIIIDPTDGSVEVTAIDQLNGDYHGYSYPAVLLPMKADDDYANRILLCGSGTSQLLDMSAAAPAWTTVMRDGATSGVNRQHSCATILPTGQVLLSGGADASDQGAVLNPELYDPATNAWTTLNDPATVLRNYHSSALLMPDGRVWTAGGNSPGQPNSAPTATQKQIEIFSPPYPTGTRPSIISCPRSASYGNQITITTDNSGIIASLVLMRCGSSTHAQNHDQRAIYLQFESVAGTNNITATIPNNPNVAIPGQYMLFTVDTSGRPCQYASFIRIAHQTCEIITDRSTFSLLEVEAGLSAGSALFQQAFYVVYDGFLPSELGGFTTAPAITFLNPDLSVVHGMSASLSDIEYEDPSLPADIPQKVTFVFDVTFANDAAFAHAPKNVSINARLAQTQGHATVNLINAPNPFMVDGPQSWLSVDLRVFQINEGQLRAGVQQNASPHDFINNLLDKFQSLPDNSYHPFLRITPDQDASHLELSQTVNGIHVFNYAVAKVHYKAPVSIPPADNSAHDVRVFFRLFNTTGTAMQYDTSGSYRRSTNDVNAISLIGKEGGTATTIPFFASPRIDYTAASMTTQPDDRNKITLPATGGESIVYFGCWLDINQTHPVVPLNPTNDGPYPASSLKSIQELIRGVHQCLVAEIYFNDDPTPIGSTPASSDNLSQRNLAIVQSDNPGNAATHTIQHTFEIKPSAFNMAKGKMTETPQKSASFILNPDKSGPDLLMIHWQDLPPQSKISVYMPDVRVDDILALEPYSRVSTTKLIKENDHTFSFVSSGINYIPIPGGVKKNIPGLLTIELPNNVVKGQSFSVLVQQARYIGASRRIIGSFQLHIPVTTADKMLVNQMRSLAVLKNIHKSIPAGDSWSHIFDKYIKGLSDKVDGLGGDSSNVPASPDDTWMHKGDHVTISTVPNNLGQVSAGLADTIKCISKHNKDVQCIKIKSVTLDIRFKDDCC